MKRNFLLAFKHEICTFVLFLFALSSYGYVETTVNLTMSVKETKKLEVPNPAQGYIDYTQWACDNSNVTILSESLGLAYVKVTKYFEGKATVQCLYVAKWYDERGWTQQTTYLRNFVITCKPEEKGQVELSITPSSGYIKKGTSVTISSNPSDAEIYYTIDGTTPSMSSLLYKEPIIISNSCTICAIGYHDDYSESDVVNASYTVSDVIEGDKFSALTPEGINIYYKITDVNKKTCEVAEMSSQDYKDPSITSITIPDTVNGYCVKSIGSHAFSNSFIKQISLPCHIVRIGSSAFGHCTSLEYICLPHEVSQIDMFAFSSCSRLRKITIPYNSNLTKIGIGAFEDCENLETVFLPRMLNSIGEDAFKGCTSIKSIYSDASTPASVSSTSFDNQTLRSSTLFVYQEHVSKYQSRYIWEKFNNIYGQKMQYLDLAFPDGPYISFFDSQYSYILSENMTAAVVTGYHDDKVLYKVIADGQTDNDVIPAGIPVVLYCRDRGCTNWSWFGYSLHETTKTAVKPVINLLYGSDEQCTTFSEQSQCYYYQINNYYEDGYKVAWKWGSENGAPFSIERRIAWLAIPYNHIQMGDFLIMEEDNYRKGDVNLDENVDISDIVAVINHISGMDVYSHSDVNLDKKTDISDIVAIINIIASGGDPAVSEGYCPDSNHPHAIDLGLDIKWACCNVGANSPEQYGVYYAWGETEEKNYYDWDSYIHCDGSSSTCHNIGKDISGTMYDVANVKWNDGWYLPSQDQAEFLLSKCNFVKTELNKVKGFRVTGPNGKSIFLPAAGNKWHDEIYESDSRGLYWTSTISPEYPYTALFFGVESGRTYCESIYRYYGRTIRPITK